MSEHWADYFASRREADGHLKRLRDEFERLRMEPSGRVPSVGDRVVFAAGLLGMGYAWVREEATVLEVGETSVRLRWVDSLLGRTKEMWVSPVLITDVLGKAEKEATDA